MADSLQTALGQQPEQRRIRQAGAARLAPAKHRADNAEMAVAQLLTGLAWAVGHDEPIDRRTAGGLIAADIHLLHRVGAFEDDRRGRWPGLVTPDGIALARASAAAGEQPVEYARIFYPIEDERHVGLGACQTFRDTFGS